MQMRKSCLAALAVVFLASATWADPLPVGKKGVKVDSLVPGDADMVMTIDIDQMLGSALVKPQLPALKAALDANRDAKQVLELIGLDPFKDLHSITLGARGTGPRAEVLGVIRGRFQPGKIHDAVAKFAKDNPEKVTLSKSGGFQLYELQAEGQPVYATFANTSTLVIAQSKEGVVAAAKNVDKPAAKLNPDLQAAISNFSGKESMWVAVRVTDELKQALAANPQMGAFAPNLKALTVAMVLDEAVNATLKVYTKDATTATAIREKINQAKAILQLIAAGNEQYGPAIAEVLENMKIKTDKTDVVVSLKITKELVDKVQKP